MRTKVFSTLSHYITKLTSKIFFAIFTLMLGLAGYFSFYSYTQTIKSTQKNTFETLKGVSNTIAFQINGDSLEKLLEKYPLKDGITSIAQDEIYASIFKILQNGRRANHLPTDIYTLSYDKFTGQLQYGISSSSTPYFRHSYIDPPSELEDNFQKGGIIENNKNKDESWLSGFSPIRNSKGEVVAVLLIDQSIQKSITEARKSFALHLSGALIFFMVLGFFTIRSIKRILKLEEISKKRLEEYVNLASIKNMELEKLSFVLKKSDNLILLTDSDGIIEWLNESYSRKNNYSSEELSRFKSRSVFEVSHYSRIKQVVDTVKRTRETFRYETKSFNQDKEEFWSRTTVTPIMDEEGVIQHLLFIDSDITDLKRAEQEIEKLAKLPLEAKNPVLRISVEGNILFSNGAAEPIVNSWNAQNGNVLQKPSIVDLIKHCLNTGKENEIHTESNGRIFRLSFTPVRDQRYVNIYGEDITERRIAEEEIRNRTLQLEQHNINITDSINYARKIQEAIMPSEDQIRKYFKDAFVLNKPRDIVSGDFYWIHETIPDVEMLVASVDCTGHGVPGAMMSLIAHSLLNDIVQKNGMTDPAQILELLNKEVIKSLRQKPGTGNDGMDISLCKINKKDLTVTFAGAYRPVYWMNGKLNVYTGDKHPIGGLFHDSERRFESKTFKVTKGDCIYMFSDGFVDQFGGPNGKKFLSKRFREMIEKNHKYSMQAQSYLYNEIFENWKGRNEQVDDVSLIGIRL